MTSINSSDHLRMRVFAGPNGSGKSTIIDAARKHKENGKVIDFGIYINADDIAQALRANKFSFNQYELRVTNKDFFAVSIASGLVNNEFTEADFKRCYEFKENRILLNVEESDEHLAQILANYIREKLLDEKKKFSFETVFSHESKLDIMKRAAKAGYKVYLYFVATEDPEINKLHVASRVIDKKHDVPPDKIIKRYYKSLELLFYAAQVAYQAYFFDNSGTEFAPVAHFKWEKGKKKWDNIDMEKLPNWFKKYYLSKVIMSPTRKSGMEILSTKEKTDFIDIHLRISPPIRVTLKIGDALVGFFQGFDDYESLKNKNKFRFVTILNAVRYKKTDIPDKAYSTIVDVDNIEDINYI